MHGVEQQPGAQASPRRAPTRAARRSRATASRLQLGDLGAQPAQLLVLARPQRSARARALLAPPRRASSARLAGRPLGGPGLPELAPQRGVLGLVLLDLRPVPRPRASRSACSASASLAAQPLDLGRVAGPRRRRARAAGRRRRATSVLPALGPGQPGHGGRARPVVVAPAASDVVRARAATWVPTRSRKSSSASRAAAMALPPEPGPARGREVGHPAQRGQPATLGSTSAARPRRASAASGSRRGRGPRTGRSRQPRRLADVGARDDLDRVGGRTSGRSPPRRLASTSVSSTGARRRGRSARTPRTPGRVTSKRVRLPQPRSASAGRSGITVLSAPRVRRRSLSVRAASGRDCRCPPLASSDMSSAVQGAPSRWESQRSFDELGRPLRDITFCVVDLETTGGSAAGRLDDHRDRRGQGARRRGARRVPDPGQPAHRDPAVHRGADRHHQLDGGRRARRSSRRCRRSSSSRPAACWSPTTRRSTSASSSTSPSSRAGRGRAFEVLDTAKLARRVITRDDAPNCKLSSLARVVQLLDHAQPPGAVRRPGHRRRAARPDGAARRPRRAHPRGAADLLRRGSAPPSAASATSPRRCRTPRASTSSATTAPGCSTSAPPATCAPGCAPTSPPPRPAPGWARWSGWPRRSTGIECATPLEAEVRELRLIAEHKPRYNRRSRFPEKVHFLKLTREPWPRLSLVRRVLDDDADYLGPFSSQEDRREVPGRAARHLPGPPVLRPARPRAVARAPACWPRWAAASSPCDGSVDADDVRRGGAPAARHPAAPARRGGRGDQRADGRAGRRRALRGGRRPPRPAGGVRAGRRPHPAALRADPVPRGGRRPPRGRRPLGRPRRPLRPAGRRRA